ATTPTLSCCRWGHPPLWCTTVAAPTSCTRQPSSGSAPAAGWSLREESRDGLLSLRAGRGHEADPRPHTGDWDPFLPAQRGRDAGGRALHRWGTGVAGRLCLRLAWL